MPIEILVMITVVATGVFIILRAFRRGRQPDAELPWLLPANFVVAMESIASAHPIRYLVLVLLAWLGICALGADAGANLGPGVQYGIGSVVALVALCTARASHGARRRTRRSS